MKRKKMKRKQQGFDLAKAVSTAKKVIDTVEQVYRAIQPVVNALTKRRKTK